MKLNSLSIRTRLFCCFLLIVLITLVWPYFQTRSVIKEEMVSEAKEKSLSLVRITSNFLEVTPAEEAFQALQDSVHPHKSIMLIVDKEGREKFFSLRMEENLSQKPRHSPTRAISAPEINTAKEKGEGVFIRYCPDFGEDAIYVAYKMPNGDILSIALPYKGINKSLGYMANYLPLVAFFAIILSLILTFFTARLIERGILSLTRAVEFVAQGNYSRRVRYIPAKEFVPLVNAVNTMAGNIAENIKEIQDQRAQLLTIFDAVYEGILVLSVGGNIRRYNKALASFFPKVQDAVGAQAIEAIPVPKLQETVEYILKNKIEKPISLRFESPVGRTFIVNLTQPSHQVETFGVVAVFFNATELLRLERVRRDFVANVSHELKTPLTAISGYAETLQYVDCKEEDMRRFAAKINDNATLLGKMVDDMLLLARVENREITLPPVLKDTREALDEAMLLCKSSCEAKELKFRVNVEDGLVPKIHGDLLVRVFRNLIENACRYSPLGGEVAISTSIKGADIIFTVADNGPGIPGGSIERIFERFYQVEQERKTKTSGLGLAICKHILERHQGRIWAESPAGSYATAIHFSLPFAEAENKDA